MSSSVRQTKAERDFNADCKQSLSFRSLQEVTLKEHVIEWRTISSAFLFLICIISTELNLLLTGHWLTWPNSCRSVRNIGRPPEFAIPPTPHCSGPSVRAVPTSGQRPLLRLQLSAARWSSAVLVCVSLGVSTIDLFLWRCLQVSSACVQDNAPCVYWFVARLPPRLCFSTALHFSACRTTALQGSCGGSGSQRLGHRWLQHSPSFTAI